MEISIEKEMKMELGDIFTDEVGDAYLFTEEVTHIESISYSTYTLRCLDGKKSMGNYLSKSLADNWLKFLVGDGCLNHYPRSEWTLILKQGRK